MPVTRSGPAPDPPPIALTRLRVDREPSRKAREAGKCCWPDLITVLTKLPAEADGHLEPEIPPRKKLKVKPGRKADPNGENSARKF